MEYKDYVEGYNNAQLVLATFRALAVSGNQDKLMKRFALHS